MIHQPSTAERIDQAIDQVLDGVPAPSASATARLDAEERALVAVGARLRAALVPPAISPRFEADLAARVAAGTPARDAVGWALSHPGRLIVTGAVGSAVGVGVTAYAVWRNSRRAPSVSHRFLHR